MDELLIEEIEDETLFDVNVIEATEYVRH